MFYLSTAQRGVGSVYDAALLEVSTETGVPMSLLKAVIAKESAWDPAARSSSSVGLMQINVAAWGVTADQALDPLWNIQQGAVILAEQLERRGGDVAVALAGYNAGTSRTDADLFARISGNVNGVGSYVADVLAYQAWYAAADPASGGGVPSDLSAPPEGGAPGEPFRVAGGGPRPAARPGPLGPTAPPGACGGPGRVGTRAPDVVKPPRA